MNSPDSLLELYSLATSAQHKKGEKHGVYAAELMREIGLKCIGLNGVASLRFKILSIRLLKQYRSHEQSTA